MPFPANAKDLEPVAGPTGPQAPAPGPLPGLGRLSPQTVGVLLAVLAPVLWSTSGMFIKVLAIEPLPLAGLRFAMAGLILAPTVRSWKIRPNRDELALVVAYTTLSLSFIVATRWTTAANAIALQSTSAAWVFVAACVAARHVPWRFTAPIAIMLAGLAVILVEPVPGTSFLGNLLGLGSGICFAVVQIFFARIKRPAFETVALANVAAALVLFVIQPGAYRWFDYSLTDWLSLAFLGGVQIGLGIVCFHAALKRISTTQVAMLTLLEPVLNPVWVFLAIGEIPSAFGFAGMGLILSGILVDSWLRRPRRERMAANPA